MKLTTRSSTTLLPLLALLAGYGETPVMAQDNCPRSPGFWCQNQNGKNPNLTPDQFAGYAADAAASLVGVAALDTAEEVSRAVCVKSDQLLRHLAALALDLAAGQLTLETPLVGEDYLTVGEAFDQAILVASNPAATGQERRDIKDVLDRIVNGLSVECPAAEEPAPPPPGA